MAKILIMDDSLMMRAVLRNFISKEGHEVIETANGEEAIAKYESEKPDIVFLDILIPEGMDGLSALSEIRKRDMNAKVIMVTSLSEKEDVDRANQAGAKGYIIKPFNRDQIIKAINDNL